MPEQPSHHWASCLSDFLPTSGINRELAKIDRDKKAIEWLKQEIIDAEIRIEKRILDEYTPEEIEAAKKLFNAKAK